MPIDISADGTFDADQEVLCGALEEGVGRGRFLVLLEPDDVLGSAEAPVTEELAAQLEVLDGGAAAKDDEAGRVRDQVQADEILQVVQVPGEGELHHHHVKFDV